MTEHVAAACSTVAALFAKFAPWLTPAIKLSTRPFPGHCVFPFTFELPFELGAESEGNVMRFFQDTTFWKLLSVHDCGRNQWMCSPSSPPSAYSTQKYSFVCGESSTFYRMLTAAYSCWDRVALYLPQLPSHSFPLPLVSVVGPRQCCGSSTSCL